MHSNGEPIYFGCLSQNSCFPPRLREPGYSFKVVNQKTYNKQGGLIVPLKSGGGGEFIPLDEINLQTM